MFDLDDTIVQHGSYVAPRVVEALKAARKAGFSLSIASGRPLCIVGKEVLQDGLMDYAICSNGADVSCLATGERLSRRLLLREEALLCYKLLEDFKPAWNAFFDGKAFFEWKGTSYLLTGRTGALARQARQSSEDRALAYRFASMAYKGARYVMRVAAGGNSRQVFSLLPHLSRAYAGVEKMGCSIPDAQRCAEAVELLRSEGYYEVVTMGPTEIEVTARGVTKGSGAKELMDALGIDRAHTVAFGDGGNDLALCDAVGRFVAMGNADDDVKDASFEVCPSVAEDGVAVWIENMLAFGGLEEGVRYV